MSEDQQEGKVDPAARGEIETTALFSGIPSAEMETSPNIDETPRVSEETLSFVASESEPQATNSASPPHLGHYEILGEIARGGMGVVYRARQPGADRIVALKLIRGRATGSQELERFQAEARAAANLDHPGIIPIYDVGHIDGEPYFTMKLVDGESLSQRISGSPLRAELSARVVRDISVAIAHAHEKGIIHRDLKPANVLLERGDKPLVADFGLAKFSSEDSGLTQSGEALGTPAFMPPEQASGDRQNVNQLSDIYALGAILYTCLTGRPPFQGASAMATVMQVMRDEPAAPRLLNRDIPKDLEIICMKCLSKEQHARYRNASELADDLSRFLAGEPINARAVTVFERSVKWVRRNPLRAMTVLACLAALMGTGLAISETMSRLGMRDSFEDAMLDNLAFGKNRHFLKTSIILPPPPTYRSDYDLRMNLVGQAIASRDFLQAQTVLSQIDSTVAVGPEYHLAQRILNQQACTARFEPRVRVPQMSYAKTGHLFILTSFGQGQLLKVDPERFALLDRSQPEYISQFAVLGERTFAHEWQTIFQREASGGQENEDKRAFFDFVELDAARWFIKADPGKNVLFAISREQTPTKVKVFSVANRELLEEHVVPHEARHVSIDVKNRRVYCIARSLQFTRLDLDDLSKQETIAQPNFHFDATACVLTPDGKSIVAAHSDFAIHRVSTTPSRESTRIINLRNRAEQMASNHDGSLIAVADARGSIYLLDVLQGQYMRHFPGHSGVIGGLCFSDDGKYLYSGGLMDHCVKKWNVERIDDANSFIKTNAYVHDVAFSGDSQHLICCSYKSGPDSNGVFIFNRGSGDVQELSPSKSSIGRGMLRHALLAPDGGGVAVFYDSGFIEFRDRSTDAVLRTFDGPPTPRLSLTRDRSGCYLSDAQQRLWRMDLNDGTLQPIKINCFNQYPGSAIAVSGDGRVGWIHCDQGQRGVVVGDLSSSNADFIPNRQWLSPLAVDHKGGRALFVDASAGIHLYDRDSEGVTWTLDLDGIRVLSAAFTPDESRIIAISDNFAIYFIDPADGSVLYKVRDSNAKCFDFAPDGSALAVGWPRVLRKYDISPLPKPIDPDAYPLVTVENPSAAGKP